MIWTFQPWHAKIDEVELQPKEARPPAKASTGGERRSFNRYEINVPLKFWYSEEIDKWQEGRVLDFSLEGLLLETDVELIPDSTLLFDFTQFVSHALDSCLITGHVVWQSDGRTSRYQYGVLFLVVENQNEMILEDEDRDRNFLVEILANLLMSGNARLKKEPPL